MAWRSVRRSLATIVAGSVLVTAATSGGPAAFAADPDPGVDSVLAFLGTGGGPGNLAAWASSLADVGKLGEPLPLVGASPGGLLGLDDLVSDALADELASSLTWDDVDVEKDVTIGGGRVGHLTSNVVDEGEGKRVNLVVTLSKDVSGRSLTLSSESPKVELSITDGVDVQVEAALSLSIVWTGETDNRVYLVSDPSTPRLDVDATASIDAAAAKAAVGILGVELTGSTLDLKAHLVGRVNDPDNDGRLSFDAPGAGDGELAPEGSLDGLMTVGLDPDGSATDPGSRGSVQASFQLGAAAGGIAGLTLPGAITSTVTVSWPDIGTGSPSVSAPDLAATVGKFQNMSLRDLADGLGQVVTSLTAVQKSKFDANGAAAGDALIGDLDLPFMKGTVSDAVRANAALVDFLQDWVVQSPDPGAPVPPGFDPATVGQPKFSSLQDLLTELENHAGISLGTLGWDPGTSKLAFDLELTKAPPPAFVPLDELSVKASGSGATYSANGLSIGTSPWTPSQWVGLRIVAGNSAGEIIANTAGTITLKDSWIGGKPANTSPFVIVGPEPHLGAVTLGNAVRAGGRGIANANADQTFATVKPSYTTKLTLVLDLQDPKTGNACIGFEGNTQACPFTRQDGPFSTQVDELPLNTDRLMLRTGRPLLTADFPIKTQVDLTANAGFFKVRLQGDLEMCNSSQSATCTGPATGHMLSIDLKTVGDAQHDIRFGDLFASLVKPAGQPSGAGDLLDVQVNVRASGNVTVSVPDADDFLPGGASASLGLSWADLSETSGPDGPQVDTSDLSEIFGLDFDPANPQALFTLIVKTLQTLSKQLAAASPGAGAGVFDKPIPGVGRSLRDLLRSDESNQGSAVSYAAGTLTDSDATFGTEHVGRAVVVGTQVALVAGVQAGSSGHTLELVTPWTKTPAAGTAYMFRSPLDDAVDAILASPPDSIQDLVEVLNDRLGSDTLGFRYLETSGSPSLVLDLDWDRDYRTSAPVRFDLGNVAGADRTFAGAQASGNVEVDVAGTVDVGLVVPLAPGDGPDDAASLKVLEDSSVEVHAGASFIGNVQGVIGPLSLALGKPGGAADTQAKAAADVSLDLATPGATADNPVSFSAFMSGVDATFNAGNSPVDCGEGLATPLMVCGQLPLFVNAAGSAGTWTPAGTIALRLPDSSTPADLTDLSGNLTGPDAALAKLEVPADLADRLLNAVLDFNNLGTGLEGYLTLIEQSFRLAAFDGKLPLVGEDLQQGADFIGDLRSTLQGSIWSQLPGGGRPLDSSEVTDFINDNLEQALEDAGMTAADISVGFVCTATLASAAAPTVGPTTAAAGSTTWAYKVVPYQGDGTGTAGDTVPSPAGSTTTGAAALGTDDFNTVSWEPVDGAEGYKVLRKGPGDSDFTLLASQATSGSGTQSYVDSNQDAAAVSAYTPVTVAPELNPCPVDAVDGVTLEFTVQQGQVSPGAGCETVPGIEPCVGHNAAGNPVTKIPLDIGIPGLALKAGPTDDPASNGINYGLGYALHFKVGISKEKGFFVNTHDGWGADDKARPELQVGLGFDLPASMRAELAFLQIQIDKATGPGHDPSKKLFAGAFQIDLLAAAGDASCWEGSEAVCSPDDNAVLTFADLTGGDIGDLFGVSLKGGFNIDWNVVADVDSAMPGVRANFQLTWQFDNNAPEAFGAPEIAFKDVGINAGEFFDGLLGPIVKEIKRVTGPIQPVMDTLYAPIPVLSDLSRLAGGDDVTLVTLAKAFNTLAGGPSLEFVDTIKAIIQFINRLPECDQPGQDCYLPLGDFEVLGNKALKTSASPTSGASLIDQSTLNARSADQVKTDLNAKNTNPAATGKPVFTTPATGSTKGDTEKAGFSFPILDDPASAFSLLMGDDITLVEFDSGPLTLGFSWRQSFGPVYAPPPVMVTLSGSASVTLQVIAGLDTAGIRHAVEAAQAGTSVDAIKLLDGLFFKTVGKDGKPVPVVRLDGEIAAGAAVSALIITVGIEGGLHLTIGFYWNDPNDDGKFRVSEFLQAAINNPLCLFTTTGRLSLFLRVYVTLGFSPFSVSFNFTLADVTLLDFTAQPDCTPPPPKLGGTVGTTLVVYAGDFGKDANRGAPWGNTGADYDGDVVKVTALHFAQRVGDLEGTNPDFDGFAVDMIGEHRDYLDSSLTRVVVDGSGYSKSLTITMVGDGKKEGNQPAGGAAGPDLAVFDKDAVVFGGSAADKIQTGTGRSYVDGGGGDDKIVTADRGGPASFARIAGGNGDDGISTGNGDNHVAGDGSLGNATRSVVVTHNDQDGGGTASLSGIVDWDALDDPTSGPDSGTGADTIGVGLGQNRVRGNDGDDKIGVATDAPDGSKKAGNNTLIGGNGTDRITGGSGNDVIATSAEGTFGVDAAGPADTGAFNVVDTGTGNDVVWGSQVEDHVSSSSKTTQHAKLVGGGGQDALIGGFGTDELFGGPGNDYVVAEPSQVGSLGPVDTIEGVSFGPSRPVQKLPLPAGTAPSSKTLVGGLGNDHILGGDGPASIFGDTLRSSSVVGSPADETCRAGSPVPSDAVPEGTSAASGDGNDLILGGAGVDTVSAGGGTDRARTFGGADLVCGQEGGDILFGGADADRIWGGSGGDRGYGETGTDHVFGNAGDDTLYGQEQDDVLEGNDGSDWASGGADDDLVYGGTRAAGRDDRDASDRGDDLYGDTGDDRLFGDNGSVATTGAPAVPLDLDGATPSAGRGDRIHGGDGSDTAFGGLGGDAVNGNAGDDHLEGNNGSDTVHGNEDEDHVVGGSFEEPTPGSGRPDTGDRLFGDGGADLLTGDNAVLHIVSAPAEATPVTLRRGFASLHQVRLLDLGASPTPGTSGHDLMSGGPGLDVLYGQDGDDRMTGDADADYAEGGPGTDWVEGNAGNDDLAGGSSTPTSVQTPSSGQPDSADAIFGGPGDDVAIGDNGAVTRPATGQTPTRATLRLSSTPGFDAPPRVVELFDLGTNTLVAPASSRFGDDQVSGGEGVDVIWGQDGQDALSGGAGDDYVEGNGGADGIRGDVALDVLSHAVAVPTLANPNWPGTGTANPARDGSATAPGQDDLIGGSSRMSFRDTADRIQGNGADDAILGDNGTLVRTLQGALGARSERVYTDRYPDGAVPSSATVVRSHDPASGDASTRFCTNAQATCEVIGAWGADTLYGDDGDDGMWGQDGNDTMYGGADDDDMHGELGDDVMFGESGEDAMLGDRGGVMNQRLSPADQPAQLTFVLQNPPKETYVGFRRGAYDRRVDLLHDADGDAWVGASTGAAMPHDGLTTGGRDRIRGGPDADNIHAGYGDDLVNGDSGGDQLFGADGEDVMWGGFGCDPVLDASTPDCLVGGVFDPDSRGTDDRMVDHLFGGAGAASEAEQDVSGSDILDVNPRGTSTTCAAGDWPVTTGSKKDAVTVDPCVWFEMTDKLDADPANDSHHHGTDWIYGGWDRDVMQGNVAENGPNPGDRLIDWNGAYNLYTHCNSAYGGFNDVRQHSPAMHEFLTTLAWGSGAGRAATDVLTSGTSAFRELAFTYTQDNKDHGSGKAYPTTPGHFEETAC